MSGILLPRRFKGQPETVAKVNWEHPYLANAAYVWYIAGGSPVINTRRTQALFGNYDQAQTITTLGRGYTSNFNLAYSSDPSAGFTSTDAPHTLFGIWQQLDTVNSYPSIGQHPRLYSGGTPVYNVYMASDNRLFYADRTPSVGEVYSFAGVNTGSAQYTLLDGVRQSTTGSYSGGGFGAATDFNLYNPYVAALVIGIVWRGVVSDSVLAELGRDPWQVLKAPARRLWAVSAATGSVALTGQSLTSAQGTLAPSTSVALTGQSLTSSQGTLTPGTAKALTGQSLTSAQGTLAPSTSVALTGQALTSAQGTLSANGSVTVALSGQSLTSSQGTLSPATAVALSGQAATSAQGTLAPATAVALSGQALTGSQGTLAPSATGQSITIQLTGISLTSYQGSLSLDQYIWDTTQGRAQPGRGTFRPLKPHEMSEPEIVVVDIPEEESPCEYVPAPHTKPSAPCPKAGISGIKLPSRRQSITPPNPANNRDYKALMVRAGKPQKTMKLSDFPATKNKKYLTKTRGPVTLKGN